MSAVEALKAQAELARFLTDTVIPTSDTFPSNPSPAHACVWPSTDWIEPAEDEDDTWCVDRTVGLTVEIFASVTEVSKAQRWLAEQVDAVWEACADGVEVLPGRLIWPRRAPRPQVKATESGATFLTVEIIFSRFELE